MTEIRAFADLHQLQISTFETTVLKRLSRIYCNMFYDRKGHKGPVIKNLTSPEDTQGIKSLFLKNSVKVKRNGSG